MLRINWILDGVIARYHILSHRQPLNNNTEVGPSCLLTVILLTTSRSRLWRQHTSVWRVAGLQARFSGHLTQTGHTHRCTRIHGHEQYMHKQKLRGRRGIEYGFKLVVVQYPHISIWQTWNRTDNIHQHIYQPSVRTISTLTSPWVLGTLSLGTTTDANLRTSPLYIKKYRLCLELESWAEAGGPHDTWTCTQTVYNLAITGWLWSCTRYQQLINGWESLWEEGREKHHHLLLFFNSLHRASDRFWAQRTPAVLMTDDQVDLCSANILPWEY